MALASVLGGPQSLGVSGYDEAMSIPSDHAHLISIRIQQILQNEINLREVADPLGGGEFLHRVAHRPTGRTRLGVLRSDPVPGRLPGGSRRRVFAGVRRGEQPAHRGGDRNGGTGDCGSEHPHH